MKKRISLILLALILLSGIAQAGVRYLVQREILNPLTNTWQPESRRTTIAKVDPAGQAVVTPNSCRDTPCVVDIKCPCTSTEPCAIKYVDFSGSPKVILIANIGAGDPEGCPEEGAECGAGKPACPAGMMCDDKFRCIRIDGACGDQGTPCCAGNTCKFNLSCIDGLCKGGGCGNIGQQCCSGGLCMNSTCAGGFCVAPSCGAENQQPVNGACCEGLTVQNGLCKQGDCILEHQAVGTGKCCPGLAVRYFICERGECGDPNFDCCKADPQFPNRTPCKDPSYCAITGDPMPGTCQPREQCGKISQYCRGERKCIFEDGLLCDGPPVVSPPSEMIMHCDTSRKCTECGVLDRPCCPSNANPSGTVCKTMGFIRKNCESGICKDCGYDGKPICKDGAECNTNITPALIVDGGMCKSPTSGGGGATLPPGSTTPGTGALPP